MKDNVSLLVRRIFIFEAMRRKRFSCEIERLNLGMHRQQFPMLKYVREHDRCTQVEIAENLHVSPAAVASSAKRMEKAGIISREADDQSLRQNRISMTEKGRTITREIESVFKKIDTEMIAGISDKELELFMSVLLKMTANICDGADFEPGSQFSNQCCKGEMNIK